MKGHKDIQRLKSLIYEREANIQQPVISSLTDASKESHMAANNILIEILSRMIARIDVIESALQRNCKNCEKYEKMTM